ncbi:MAG TPA: (Fe-S)-binding protein [Deltaproteobacteria bacterium]|nr:(Fe-S)-binding protein [Deltaproteobacteria bacterium]HXK47411.1 (Fe-S)-binding protein [Deltaproteobacteria bacterium]
MKVSLFIPCTVDLMMPEIGTDVFRLLKRLGMSPVYHRGQTCCGQPLFNAGYRDQAKRAAKHFIEVFGNDERVVSPAGSCVTMVKHHYPELLSDEPHWHSRAVELAGRILELSQFVVDTLGVTDVGASFEGKVTYHESCHILRGLGVSDQPKKLIASVKGVQYVEMNSATACCGFGGEFSVAYPEISEAMVKDKAGNFLSSGADVLLLSEPGCLLNIGGYLHRNHPGKKAMHLASFLAENA